MKKLFIFFLCIGLILSSFTGCGNSTSPTADNIPEEELLDESQQETPTLYEGETTDVLVWLYAGDSMKNYVNDSFFERIKEALPQYNVTIEVISGTAEDMEIQYAASKEKGIVPDAMYVVLTTFANFGYQDEWLVLDEYMEDWEGNEDIMEAALSMGKLSGSYMGIGCTPAPSVFVYRTDYFEEAGLDPQSPPTTWQELEEYAKKLTQKKPDGSLRIAGLDIPTIDNYGNFSFPFMRMNGAIVVDESEQLPYFQEAQVIETLEFLYHLSSLEISYSYNWQDSGNIPFVKGDSAMGFMNLDQYVRMIQENPQLKDKVGIALPLGNELVTSFCGYRMMTIPADAKNPDGGWEVTKFIMSKEEMQIRVEQHGVIPVRTSLMENYETLNPHIGRSVMETVSVGKGAFLVPWVSTMYRYYGPAYQAVMKGEKTAAQAMEEVQNGILSEINP